jgi:anti-anti-sigma factor
MHMEVNSLSGNLICVRLSGRMDAAGAGRVGVPFAAQVAAADGDALIDLSGVSFIASMGIRLLLSTARDLDRKGNKLVLFGACDLVHEVLEQAAIDRIIPLVATEREAMAQFGTA